MATTKEPTASSRRPSTSSSAAEDDIEKESSWPTSWWIGGGIAGTIIVCILGHLIHILFFVKKAPEKATAGMECLSEQHEACMDDLVCIEAMEAVADTKAANGTVAPPAQGKGKLQGTGKFYCKAKASAGMECPSEQHEACMDDLVCIEAMETVAAIKATNDTVAMPEQVQGNFYCKAKVDVGGKCPSKKHEECVDTAICSGGTCKALLGESCSVVGDCWNPHKANMAAKKALFDFHLPENRAPRCYGTKEEGKTCQVKALEGKDGADNCYFGKNIHDTDDKLKVLVLEGMYCKGGEGMLCGSPRGGMPKWCKNGLECLEDEKKAWRCTQKPAVNGAQIQLGETTATWSRLTQSNNLRKKRTHTPGFLQVDLD